MAAAGAGRRLPRPQTRGFRAMSPGLLRLGKLARHGTGAARHAHSERVENEGLGGLDGVVREILKAGAHDVVGKGGNGIHAVLSGQQTAALPDQVAFDAPRRQASG